MDDFEEDYKIEKNEKILENHGCHYYYHHFIIHSFIYFKLIF
jgi:hypothetical protein